MAESEWTFGKNERKEKRKFFQEGERSLTQRQYNALIGGVLFYGLLMNTIFTAFMTDAMLVTLYNYYGLVLIGYLVFAFAGVFMTRSRNPVLCFVGYNFVVLPIGVIVSMIVPAYSTDVVFAAILGTTLVVMTMTAIASAFPNAFMKMGRALLITLSVAVLVELILLLFGISTGLFDFLFVGIFSLYIGFDWVRANSYYPSVNNAVASACDLYLDIVNIFIRLLSILGRNRK